MARRPPAFTRGVEEGGEGRTAWWAQLGPKQWRGWKSQAEVKAVVHDCSWLGRQGEQRNTEGDQGKLSRKAAGGRRGEAGGHLEGEPWFQEQFKGRGRGGEEPGCERGE